MIEQARKDGVASEKTMWESIASVNDLLVIMDASHPEMVQKFLRKQHELMYGPHYNEMWAIKAVAGIEYTDREGKKRTGAYWTVEQVEDATRSMSFPTGTTKWDKFVALNVFRSDVCRQLTDSDIINSASAFFFADEDYNSEGKIWHYMSCIR